MRKPNLSSSWHTWLNLVTLVYVKLVHSIPLVVEWPTQWLVITYCPSDIYSFLWQWNFIKFRLLPTSSFKNEFYLMKNTCSSNEYFLLFQVVELMFVSFLKIPYKDTIFRFNAQLVRINQLGKYSNKSQKFII